MIFHFLSVTRSKKKSRSFSIARDLLNVFKLILSFFYYSFDLARIPALEQALGMLMIAEKKSTAKLRFLIKILE